MKNKIIIGTIITITLHVFWGNLRKRTISKS